MAPLKLKDTSRSWNNIRCHPDGFRERPCFIQQVWCHATICSLTGEWLHRKRGQVLDWPTSSLELSPTENVWHIMKCKICHRPQTVEHISSNNDTVFRFHLVHLLRGAFFIYILHNIRFFFFFFGWGGYSHHSVHSWGTEEQPVLFLGNSWI